MTDVVAVWTVVEVAAVVVVLDVVLAVVGVSEKKETTAQNSENDRMTLTIAQNSEVVLGKEVEIRRTDGRTIDDETIEEIVTDDDHENDQGTDGDATKMAKNS